METELESLIDKHGLYGVVLAIESICHGKAEHLASNWQDKDAAKRWQSAGKELDKLHSRLVKIQLP